jgi:hypothetical protein
MDDAVAVSGNDCIRFAAQDGFAQSGFRNGLGAAQVLSVLVPRTLRRKMVNIGKLSIREL